MLKAQLHSKFFHLDDDWRQAEDVLTGDFFGVLDYLPRASFLADFLHHLHVYDGQSSQLEVEGVDWAQVEIDSWPMTYADDENAEPDLLVISNRWLIVVEVKLDSGLGRRQPWRGICGWSEARAGARSITGHRAIQRLSFTSRAQSEEPLDEEDPEEDEEASKAGSGAINNLPLASVIRGRAQHRLFV